MTRKIFPVQEIGSIAKPGWRVKGVANPESISPNDVREAERWGRELGVDGHEELIRLLKSPESIGEREKQQIREWSIKYAIRLFERSGLDIVYSGEQWRVEMYEHLARNIRGFEFLGSVQSFDNKYYTKAAIRSQPEFVGPIHLEELKFVQRNTGLELKVPITGPYTLVDWSFNEFYESRLIERSPKLDAAELYFEARREFMLDCVRDVLRKEVQVLVDNGAKYIQIDEPAITTRPGDLELSLFVEAINELTRGFGGIEFSVHNCYSDYNLLARFVPQLKDVTILSLEFANRDSTNCGTDAASRVGYSELKVFEDEGYAGKYALGVEHVHNYLGNPGSCAALDGGNIMETPKLVRDRILYATKVVGDPGRIIVNPDCGLRTRDWDVTYAKLRALSEGASLAREEVA